MFSIKALFAVISHQSLSTTCMWVSLIFYLLCFFPQILINYRSKNGKGISELMLMGYLNAYFFLLFYIFCLPLPFAYRLMVPLHALATLFIVGQRLYYDSSTSGIRLRWIYGLNALVFVFIIPIAYWQPVMIGSAFGWGNFIISVFNQLPQVVKVYQTRSVAGFSFLFVLFAGFASTLEAVVAFVVGLPLQTVVGAMRGVVLFFVFSGQFFLYRNNVC